MKIGPGRNSKSRRALVEDRRAGHVRRHQVGRELDAREVHPGHLRERAGDQGLREPGVVLDQDVPVGEQAEQDELERFPLAHDRPLDLGEQALAAFGGGLDLGHRPQILSSAATTSRSWGAGSPAA